MATNLELTQAAFDETLHFIKKGVGYDVIRGVKCIGHVKRVNWRWYAYSAAVGKDVKCYGASKTREGAARFLTVV